MTEIMKPHFHFNHWKHHAGSICRSVRRISRCAIRRGEPLLRAGLLHIGDNNLDLYIGRYGLAEIFGEIGAFLQTNALYERKSFLRWLAANGGYRKVIIGDDSGWILRSTAGSERYLHIHPAKYTPQTIRCRAGTLKTAILILHHISAQPDVPSYREAASPSEAIPLPDVQRVNTLRDKLAGLPPLADLSAHSAVSSVVKLLLQADSSPVTRLASLEGRS